MIGIDRLVHHSIILELNVYALGQSKQNKAKEATAVESREKE